MPPDVNKVPILDEPEDRAEALLDLSISLIESAIDILQNHITDDKQLQHQSTLMPGGTVGKHFRHVIETFQAFLLPLSSNDRRNDRLEINYDAILPASRRPLARSLSACTAAMQTINNDLRQWGERARRDHATSSANETAPGQGFAGETRGTGGLAVQMDRPVKLVAVTPTKQVVGSTIGRELWFCSLHAIHHFSMLRTIAVHELGLSLPVEFGTAPSTLLYRGKDWKPPPEKKEVRVVRSKL